MEKQKGNQEKTNDINGSHTHSLIRKTSRNLSASPYSSLPLNPRDSPDFFTCHSCGIHDGGLQTLDSQWRVVLLCHGCLARVRSAAVCSYCFKSRDVDVLVCRSCLCLVHISCVPVQRSYITISEFDPVSFTCIDCCAIPRPQLRDTRLSRVLLENLVRNVSSAAKKKVALAARARLKALKKADEARVAMELAFDAILFARDAVAEDRKLAKQLHRVINGSPRIMRKVRQDTLGHYLRVNKHCVNGSANSMRRKSKKWRGRVHEKVGICCKKDDTVLLESNNTSLSERNSYIESGIVVEEELLEIDARYESDSTEVTLVKKRGRHCDVVVNYDGEVSNGGWTLISCRESADSNSFMEASECGRGVGENSLNLKEEECTVPDCCVLKCRKITSRLKQY